MIKAILFDVFGTLVDWRRSIVNEAKDVFKNENFNIDLEKMVIEWRLQYLPALSEANRNDERWKNLDEIHQDTLEKVLNKMRINFLNDIHKEKLVLAWHKLKPWEDSCETIKSLNNSFITATLSNGHIELQKNLLKNAKLDIDFIFSAEHFKKYKPEKIVYLGSANYLNLKTTECALVASHKSDLQAASRVGYKTIFVSRVDEYGQYREKFSQSNFKADINLNSFKKIKEIFL